MTAFNIYCDESCHLEHDGERVMVLGAVVCPSERRVEVAERLRDIKTEHGLPPSFEIKWSKVSPAGSDFYRSVLDYFFDDDDLSFRALIVPDKTKLDHEGFHQTHDEFYYKMYFDMLKVLFDPACEYSIYLDIKDTRSATKTRKLQDILTKKLRSEYGISGRIIRRIQLVRSHEVQLVQMSDLLVGAVSYANRGLKENAGKRAIVERMRERAHHELTSSTLYGAKKVNLLRWRATEAMP
jgi:hypothetical protein